MDQSKLLIRYSIFGQQGIRFKTPILRLEKNMRVLEYFVLPPGTFFI